MFKKYTNELFTLKKVLVYALKGIQIELFIMGRPWLSADEFKVKF